MGVIKSIQKVSYKKILNKIVDSYSKANVENLMTILGSSREISDAQANIIRQEISPGITKEFSSLTKEQKGYDKSESLLQKTFEWVKAHKKQIAAYTGFGFTLFGSYYGLKALFGDVAGGVSIFGLGVVGATITPKIHNFYGLVYVVKDKRTGKVYVGQTIRKLRDRFAEHLRNPPNKYFREAVNFYKQQGNELKISQVSDRSFGTENLEFIIEIVGEAHGQKKLNELEIKEIKNRKSCVLDFFTIKDGQILPLYGYNIQRGGTYSVLSLRGKSAITYSHINRGQLKALIKRGLFVSEIARELMVPDLIVITKIQEFWASQNIFSLDQARKAFGGYDIYKSRMKHISTGVPSSISFSEDQLKKLVYLIKKGYSTSQMKFEMNIDSSDLYSMLQVLGFSTFTSVRDHYGSTELFYKKCRETLINNVRRGKSHSYYIEVDEGLFISLIEQNYDYKILAQKLKIAERTVYEKSYELLDMSLPEAERIYRIYPKIEKKLLNARNPRKRLKTPFFQDLITNGLTVEEIDKEFLKILIALGYSKKELEGIYGWDHSRMTRWVANILKMDFYRAVEEFWWKPRIIWLFRLGYSARQMRDVSLGLIGKHVTYDVLTRVFAEEFRVHGSNTWKYLQRLYGS